MFPALSALLTAVHDQPVLATVGVNPAVLQFYVSESKNRPNFLRGAFHRYFIAGIVSSYNLAGSDRFVTLTIPSFHPLSRHLHFFVPANCLADPPRGSSPLREGDANSLAFYAYTAEIEPVPRFEHLFECESRGELVSRLDLRRSLAFGGNGAKPLDSAVEFRALRRNRGSRWGNGETPM